MKYLIASIFLMVFTPSQKKEDWVSLIDKDLSQWDNYLSYHHQIGYDGSLPKDENGNAIPPIGYNKNTNHVFSVVEENDEQQIRISGEFYGSIITKKEYQNFHLKLKMKWGNLKFDPRKDKLKDSGILYHSIGESGVDYWRAWMLSQELQIMEGHIGDYWSIANSAIDIKSFPSEGKMNSVANVNQPFRSFGSDALEGFCLRSENFETPNNGWTTIELICFEDKSIHIVNGHVVMILQHSRYIDESGKAIPLTHGKIQIQSEASEAFYKDIQIRDITSMPIEYAKLF